MKLRMVAAAALLAATVGVGMPVLAENPAQVQQLLETGRGPGFNLSGANLSGAEESECGSQGCQSQWR
jgi:hypothetical protein